MPCGYGCPSASGSLTVSSGSVRMTRRARGLAASVDATADGHNRITCKALPNRCGLDGYRDDAFSLAAGHRPISVGGEDLHGSFAKALG